MLFDRIELFVAAAKHQNLAKTAREMHVSASSVCQRLKSLERDLSAKLYKKNKDGIELTDAGRILLSAAGDILNRIETLKKTLSTDTAGTIGSLAVGGTHNPSARQLPSAIAAFQKTHPSVKVTFLTATRFAIEKSLRECEIDIAIIQSPSENVDFHMEHFGVDNITFVAHPAHPLARKPRLAIQDLADAPLIIREGKGSTDKMLRELKSRGLQLNIVLRCASPDGVKAAVRRKMGIGILFNEIVEPEVQRKELKILRISGLPKLVGNSYIAYSKKKPLSPAANDFLQLLRSRKARESVSLNLTEPSTRKTA